MPPAGASEGEGSFDPGPRYRVLRRVGSGGMGVVYEALDLQYARRLAIKTLKHAEPQLLFALKQEFRSLADVRHPNLIALYELFADTNQCFFTMEFVDGVDLLQYVRNGYGGVLEGPQPGVDYTATLAGSTSGPVWRSSEPVRSPEQLERLRQALMQIAAGLDTIHEAGKLHRDLKPSNILVSPEGRAVILDFGLMSGLEAELPGRGSSMSGTFAYMSPEQSANERLSPASDWYAVGAMVYEALTGTLPFTGGYREILRGRLFGTPQPVAELAPGLPPEWGEVAARLLERDPGTRWTARDVRRWAGNDTRGAATVRTSGFLGRDAELRKLLTAFEHVRAGKPACVFLHGDSGMGKSELIRHAIRNIQASSDETIVLSGRCYEQEAVAFKAIDGLIDGLSDFLRALPGADAGRLLPSDTPALARVFPVLRQCDAIRDFRTRRAESASELETRRRAFGALRDLMLRLGDTRPVVLVIDDLQWGDADSAMLLREILRPPDSPVLLLIGSWRSGFENKSECLKLLLSEDAGLPVLADLNIGPLGEEYTLALAGEQIGGANGLAVQVAKESGGNPYFLKELLRRAASGGTSSAVAQLDSLLWERVAELDPDSRKFVITLSVAGQPLRTADVFSAAGVGHDPEIVARLRASHLVRTIGDSNEIDVYHDRVRESVLAQIGDTQALHEAVATTLDAAGGYGAELRASHWQAAGRAQRAGELYAEAASEAARALAFDHAAHLYLRALELQQLRPSEAYVLQVRLAECLTNAGRSVQAARVYAEAARLANEAEALTMESRAAYQFCISGQLEEAQTAFERVFERARLRPPAGLLRTIASTVLNRLYIDTRGLKFRAQSPHDLPLAATQRLDAAWYGSTGFGLVDPVSGPWFTARNLVLSLQAGDPSRVARAIAWEAATRASGSAAGRKQAERMFPVCEQLINRYPDAYSRAILLLSRGTFHFTAGRWRASRGDLEEAERILMQECRGVRWEIATARTFQQYVLFYLGEINVLRRALAAWLEEARELGDLYLETNLLMVGYSTMATVDGQSDDGLQRARAALARWPQRGFDLFQMIGFMGEWWLLLGAGRSGEGWQSVQHHWPVLKKYFILQNAYVGSIARYLRARTAIAAGATDWLRIAEKDARDLDRAGLTLTPGLAACVRASAAAASGRRDETLGQWERAWRCFDESETHVFAHPARREYGLLLGGDEGREHVAAAEAWMESMGVRNYDTMCRTYVSATRSPDK